MENTRKHQVHGGGGSSSSNYSSSARNIADELFGPKEPSSSSSSSIFGSVFGPPPPTVRGMDSSHQSMAAGSMGMHKPGSQGGNNRHATKGENSSNSKYQQETSQPSYLCSSIYYGGQEVYSPPTQPDVHSHPTPKKNGQDDDPNGNNSIASRGEWWQGSVYY